MVNIQKSPIVKNPEALKLDSLEAWLNDPLKGTEWVNGRLTEKTATTLTHGKVQGSLSYFWHCYQEQQKLGGQVYTGGPCKTQKQGRRIDVAYLTPELLTKYGNNSALPQSFPLSAEVVSPFDKVLDVFGKANEYLSTGGKEVWLVFPESALVIVMTERKRCIFGSGEIAKTQIVLPGFEISVDELLA